MQNYTHIMVSSNYHSMQLGNTHEANQQKASESHVLEIGKHGSMRGRGKTVIGFMPVIP